ncbi:MAG: EAL domain-containing protein, partial [Gammaproteobacteria bacterium]|nr:EAL domain-containing protein [Gammaproteobacteria bacterium]
MTTQSVGEVKISPAPDPAAEVDNSSASSGPRALVGRQPILDRALNVMGYELLFRPSAEEAPAPFDGNRATAQVILNTVTEIGLENVVGKHRAFINFTDELLIDGTARLLPHNQVVLEVLEDAVVNEELMEALTVLVDAGYELALDDFVYEPKWDYLMRLASIIKIDVLASSREEICSLFERCKAYDVKLLAEKVETQEQFDELFELGFDLFQGYFFTEPKVISQERIPENHINLLNLLAKLQDIKASTSEIERLVSLDISLSFKLLRSLNSAYFSMPQKIDSIHRAVVYVGLDMLRRWASLMVMANVEGKPSELLQTA